MSDIEEELRAFIGSMGRTRTNRVVQVDEPLISSGQMDSLALVQVMTFVEERFGVNLLASGSPSEFDTVAGLAGVIRRTRGAA